MSMRIYEVPMERTLTEADPKVSDWYRRNALHCLTMVERWQAVDAIKSERAKYLAAGIVLGVVFSVALMVLL